MLWNLKDSFELRYRIFKSLIEDKGNVNYLEKDEFF